MTATHVTVKEMTVRMKGYGHIMYMDIFFLSLDLSDDMIKKRIHCCGTVTPNRKGMPWDLEYRSLKLKKVILGKDKG
jgi:hypothetical protein